MTPEQEQKLSDIHRALFEVPPGSDKDAKPLIVELRAVVKAYQRTSFVVRGLVWTTATIAGIIGGIKVIGDAPAAFANVANWFGRN